MGPGAGPPSDLDMAGIRQHDFSKQGMDWLTLQNCIVIVSRHRSFIRSGYSLDPADWQINQETNIRLFYDVTSTSGFVGSGHTHTQNAIKHNISCKM